MALSELVRPLFRKKQIDPDELGATQLRRCLTLIDLVLLGLGKTLGAGVYVVTGQVAKHKAGPGMIVSFLIAAVVATLSGKFWGWVYVVTGQVAKHKAGPGMIVSFLIAAVVATLSALCYAEFGARVPKAGSAYIYTYIAVGEGLAFIVGWSLFLQNCIGGASVARATSAYLDALLDNRIATYMTEHLPMDHPGLADYPDFLALGLCLLFAFLMIFGVKESSTFNNIFAGLNMYVIVYIIACGAFKADLTNWSITAAEVPKEPCQRIIGNQTIEAECSLYGSGGFFPYGFQGVVAGAAMCFYAFIGFDVISTTGEEAKNPQRNIPLGTMLSLLLVFLAYFGVSAVLTLMLPYYSLDEAAPLPVAFDNVGWWFAMYIVTIGGICGLITSLFGCIFAMPRYIYSMASDGLLYSWLGWVSSKSKTPIVACLLCGTLSGILALFLDIEALVNIVAAGTLLPYALVAACVLILRYEPDEASAAAATILYPRFRLEESKKYTESSFKSKLRQTVKPRYQVATGLSSAIVTISVCLLFLCFVVLSALIVFCDGHLWAIIVICFFSVIIFVLLFIIWRQPQNSIELIFKVPLLPFIPAISLFINIYLLFNMDQRTWIGYAGFMAIGLLIYITYGIKHSKERKTVAICDTDPIVRNEDRAPSNVTSVRLSKGESVYATTSSTPLIAETTA